MNEFRGHADALRQVVAQARAKLPELPREEAARAAGRLLTIEGSLTRSRNRNWPEQLRAFVKEWAGTEAALLVEVDVIGTGGTSPAKLDALDAFAREHPQTVAGAKATYLRGSYLAHNAAVLGLEPRGGDPLKRFMAVSDVVSELESGRHPQSEWVARAPELVVQFFAAEPKYEEGSLARILAVYEQFVKTHFTLDHRGPTHWGIGYLITRKMADLYALNGDRIGGVERMLTDLEGDSAKAASARYLRALFYLQLKNEKAPVERQLVADARRTLETLLVQGDELYRRKALSTLAVIEQQEGEHALAVQHLTKYVQSYPESPWAWVASLRLGKAYEALGNWPSAAKAHLDTASRHASIPPARTLAHAYAAHAQEAAAIRRCAGAV
jgi:outer membrane protein assembly factor BamD (BamD/ComL family)